jgi:hypothetical protein
MELSFYRRVERCPARMKATSRNAKMLRWSTNNWSSALLARESATDKAIGNGVRSTHSIDLWLMSPTAAARIA